MERNSDRIGACFMFTSLGDLDRNYWHHLNYLEPANMRIMFRCIVELNLNDFINIHMQQFSGYTKDATSAASEACHPIWLSSSEALVE